MRYILGLFVTLLHAALLHVTVSCYKLGKALHFAVLKKPSIRLVLLHFIVRFRKM